MLFALELEEYDRLALAALPIDRLHWTYANANRDPGEIDSNGRVIRPAAAVVKFDTIRTFNRNRSNLDSKSQVDPNWDYSLQGAKADRDQFEAWAGGKLHREFIPTKEN